MRFTGSLRFTEPAAKACEPHIHFCICGGPEAHFVRRVDFSLGRGQPRCRVHCFHKHCGQWRFEPAFSDTSLRRRAGELGIARRSASFCVPVFSIGRGAARSDPGAAEAKNGAAPSNNAGDYSAASLPIPTERAPFLRTASEMADRDTAPRTHTRW